MPRTRSVPLSASRPAPRSLPIRAMLWLLAGMAFVLGAVAALEAVDAPPRSLAPYLASRLEGHSALLSDAGQWLASRLTTLDRGPQRTPLLPPLRVGAQSRPVPAPAGAQRSVASEDELVQAIAGARPGDVIVVQPATYRFERALALAVPGTARAPITLRAQKPGGAILEIAAAEGLVVSAPYWSVENLAVHGVCAEPADCQHALHVVGRAAHFTLRNSTLVDFNAPIKINGEHGHFPDHGLIEGNTLGNTAARATDDPVTGIDLVGASHWTVRANVMADIVKTGGDRISYAAFAKGGGSGNRFERNLVVCELRLRGTPGWRVGLSLGGGGTGAAYCRDGQCITEQEDSVIESNLIASCSDDGIYLNRAATSRVVHNSVIDTAGVSVRFGQSSAELEGNLIDGVIRSRDGGAWHGEDNLHTGLASLYLGRHPLRALYRDAPALDFAWQGGRPRRDESEPMGPDLCGTARPAQPAYGAFEDFSQCTGQ